MHNMTRYRRRLAAPAAVVAVILGLTTGGHTVDIHNADDFNPWPWPADTNRDLGSQAYNLQETFFCQFDFLT